MFGLGIEYFSIIRINEPPNLRIIVAALQIVESRLGVIPIAAVAVGVLHAKGSGQGPGRSDELAPAVVGVADNGGSSSIRNSCHITLEVCEIEVLTAIVSHGERSAIAVIGVMERLGSGGLKGYFPAQVSVLRRNAIDRFLGTQAAGVVLEA